MEQNHKRVVGFKLVDKRKIKNQCYYSIYEAIDKNELLAMENILVRKEKEYFSTLSSEPRKISYLLGRLSAFEALKEASLMQNVETGITNGIFGQPVLHDKNFEVSITHTKDVGGCVLYPRDMLLGIDIEDINSKHCSAMRSVTTDNEYLDMKKIISNDKIVLTIIWTLKEAIGKAIKVGFTLSTDIMAVHAERYDEQSKCLISSFVNFPQYKAKSFIFEKNVMSIVYPANTEWCDEDE